LIMVTLPTVSSFFSSCGCFLRDGRSSSGDLPSLSVACGWPPGAKILWVQGNGGRTDPQSGPGRPAWADRPRPIPARFGRPFAPVGPQVIMHFAPSICIILTMSSSRPRWRFFVHEVGLLRFNPRGCSYVALRSTPPLEVILSSS
jgi:hypothetical protein